MSFEENELGFFIPKESQATKGGTNGWVNVKMDSHALAYLNKGLECRIDVYEKMQLGGPLPSDDEVSFNYTKRLRDAVRDARVLTLEPE